jgi:hypothetical protein
VAITHHQIREHLRCFAVQKIENDESDSTAIAEAVGKFWSGNDFAHVLLSTMVGQIIESVKKNPSVLSKTLKELPSAMQIRLIEIVCVCTLHPRLLQTWKCLSM